MGSAGSCESVTYLFVLGVGEDPVITEPPPDQAVAVRLVLICLSADGFFPGRSLYLALL